MNKTNYHYIHFPLSLLKDVIERKELALKDIKETYCNQTKATKGITNCSIKMSMLDEFINKKKTEKQWYELLGFLAVKSILGTSKDVITNYKHILSRMLGYPSYDKIKANELTANQLKLFNQYTRNNDIAKDKMKTLLNRLESNWNVMTYSRFMQGFYLSIKGKTTYEALAKKCEERREINKTKERNQLKKNAYLSYKSTLNPSIKSTEF